MIRAVIFDLDGTLYDSTGLHRLVALKELSRLAFFRVLKERLARKELAGKDFGSGTEFENAFFRKVSRNWYLQTYLPDMVSILRERFHPREGLENMLEVIRSAGIKTAVFSDYGHVREKLDALGIDPGLFDGLYDAASLGGLKPCRESFLKVCDTLGVKPGDALMIGDRTDTDGAGAIGCGMQFVHLIPDGTDPKPDGILHLHWAELKDYIHTQTDNR